MVAAVSIVVSIFALFIPIKRHFQFPNFVGFSTNGEIRYNAKHSLLKSNGCFETLRNILDLQINLQFHCSASFKGNTKI